MRIYKIRDRVLYEADVSLWRHPLQWCREVLWELRHRPPDVSKYDMQVTGVYSACDQLPEERRNRK